MFKDFKYFFARIIGIGQRVKPGQAGFLAEAPPRIRAIGRAFFSSFFAGQTRRDDYNERHVKLSPATPIHLNLKGGIEK
jgi:hypothetical protein